MFGSLIETLLMYRVKQITIKVGKQGAKFV